MKRAKMLVDTSRSGRVRRRYNNAPRALGYGNVPSYVSEPSGHGTSDRTGFSFMGVVLGLLSSSCDPEGYFKFGALVLYNDVIFVPGVSHGRRSIGVGCW